MEQTQVVADVAGRVGLAVTACRHKDRQPPRFGQFGQGRAPRRKCPLQRNDPGKSLGWFMATRKAIVPPQSNPARKTRCRAT